MKNDWEDSFSPVAISRGHNCFYYGNVHLTNRSDSGLEATVHDIKDYQVRISDDVKSATCNCADFSEGKPCRHIAALYYEKEYLDSLHNWENEDSGSGKKTSSPSIKKMLDSLDDLEKSTYLNMILKKDSKWRADFYKRYADINFSNLKEEFISDAYDVINRCCRRNDVYFRNAYKCDYELGKLLDSFLVPLIDRKAYHEAFKITAQLILLLPRFASDNPGDFYPLMMERCADYWKILLEKNNTSATKEMIAWMSEFIADDAKNSNDERSFYGQLVGCIQKFLLESLEKNQNIAAEVKDFAEKILQDCFSTKAAFLLLKIYRIENDKENTRRILWDIAVKGNIDSEDELKSLYKDLIKAYGKGWKKVEGDFCEQLAAGKSKLSAYFLLMGYYEELLNVVENDEECTFGCYWNELATRFPQRYLEISGKKIKEALKGPMKTRSDYRNQMYNMTRLQKLPGGEEYVARLMEELREMYPRRKALIDELDKFDSFN